MNTNSCHREDELLDALGRGYIGAELSSHIDQCPACTEIRVVAAGLLDERAQAITESHLPSSGTMLWRMQMRLRQEAAAAARRSLLIGQAVTLTVAIALMVVIFGGSVAVEAREIFATLRVSTPLLLALATWVLLAPIGGYLAIRQK
jgi:hypothetical protein